MATYTGFSFFRYGYDKTITLTDIELVKTDIYNHIFTRRGDRVKMPTFGTVIPDLLFEPLTIDVVEMVEADLRTVFSYDPRVELISLNVYPLIDKQTLYVAAELNFVELSVIERFDLNLEFQG